MTHHARILLAGVLLSAVLGSQGLKFTIVRAPGNFYCARISCTHDVDDVSSVSNTKLVIYDATLSGERLRLASVSQNDPGLFIEASRRDEVNGTGSFSKDHTEIVLDLRDADACLRGSFQCEAEFVNVKGKKDVITENVQPGDQEDDCTCAAIVYQFAVLTARADSTDSSIYSLRRDTTELQKDETDLQQSIAARQQEITKIKQNSATTEVEINVLQQISEDASNDIARLDHDVTESEADAVKLKVNYDARVKDVADLKTSFEAKETELASIKQTDNDNNDALNKFRNKDTEFEEDINEIKRRDRDTEKEINRLQRTIIGMKADISSIQNDEKYLTEDISALEESDNGRTDALNNLAKDDDLISQEINDLTQSFASLQGIINGLLNNDTTFIAEINALKQVDKQVFEALAVLDKKNQFTQEELNILNQNNQNAQDTIRGLFYNDTVLQRQIDELKGRASSNQRESDRLNETDVTLTAAIVGLDQSDAALQEKWTALAVNYASLEQEAILLRREQSDLVQTLATLEREVITFQGYLNSTQITTVVRTTTNLVQTTCSRGMAHNKPREPVLLWGKVSALCDTETDGGGWIVVLEPPTGNLNRTWSEYKTGFTERDGYYLGNDFIHDLSDLGYDELRVEWVDNGQARYAQYSRAEVGTEFSNYRLAVSGYTGTGGDVLAYHDGMQFSTFDRDNDRSPDNCAAIHGAGFYYNDCFARGTDWFKGITEIKVRFQSRS